MLTRIWINPPLAIGRLGPSDTPCDAFLWSAALPIHDGPDKTVLMPVESLTLNAGGDVSVAVPEEIVFKDAQGMRPVCPFFELHGEWTLKKRRRSGALTPEILTSLGLSLRDISWRIEAANLKAWHYTFEPGDRIEGKLRVRGDDTRKHVIEGRSPARAAKAAVSGKAFIRLGHVQLAKPSAEFPELRLRYHPPKGLVYGPRDLPQRIAGMTLDFGANNDSDSTQNDQNQSFSGFTLPADQLIVNPAAHWARHSIELSKLGPFPGADDRNNPASLFAFIFEPQGANAPVTRSLGLFDDTSDAVITCAVKAGAKELTAQARITCGPPDYAPASRHPSTMADNLADREDRASPRRNNWSDEELRDIVLDIFERAFESSDQMNKDFQNHRCTGENDNTLSDLGRTSALEELDVKALLWPEVSREDVLRGAADPLVLSHAGTRKHRRQAALQYLEEHFRDNPELFRRWIRTPLDSSLYFDRRMPALMRGSDGRPYHLTRRQWEIIKMWIDRIGGPAKAAGVRRRAPAVKG